ncbi:F-box protein CPR1 [Rosa sericea]
MSDKCTRKKIMSVFENFPEEIIQGIFVKLPIKSLVQCTAVCKSWKSLIMSSTFIDAHLRRIVQPNSQTNVYGLFLLTACTSQKLLFSLHLDNPAFDEYTKLTSPLTTLFKKKLRKYSEKESDFNVAGTCNGLVCLASKYTTIIWNPCIRKYMVLPRPITLGFESDWARCDFGYDSHTNDYKVLRSVNNFYGKRTACEVWSLARGSWKIISAGVVPAYFRPLDYSDRGHDVSLSNKHAFVNGALHWIPSPKGYPDEVSYIVSFDLFSERFSKIMIPTASEIAHVSILRYRESLALLVQSSEKLLHLWVMKEYSVVESWTKLSTLPLQERIWCPLGFRKSGEVLLKMYVSGVQLVDPNTGQVTSELNQLRMYNFMDPFVRSLLLFDQPNAICY